MNNYEKIIHQNLFRTEPHPVAMKLTSNIHDFPICRNQHFDADAAVKSQSFSQYPSFEGWVDISLMIKGLIRRLGFNTADIYLVGGALRREQTLLNKDMDTVIILDTCQSISELVKVRSFVSSRLCELGVDHWYHYKLLNICELRKMTKYDGFRIREFQLANFSLLNSKLIESLNPMLNRQSFANSLIIQTAYETHDPDRVGENIFDIHNSLQKRLFRNSAIYGQIPEPIIEMWWNLSKAVLSDGWHNVSRMYFEDYYCRFPHEYINKRSKYLVNTKHKALRW